MTNKRKASPPDDSNAPKKRTRRTKRQLDEIINDAMKKLVSKKGFANLTLLAIAKQAKVEPPVIYNKFGNLDGLLKAFTKKYENWLNEIIDKNVKDLDSGNHQRFVTRLTKDIALKLYDDRVMQQLLVWEVQGKNNITKDSAIIREENTYPIIHFYDEYFKGANIDFNMLLTVLIAGVYYVVLHKDASTFCGIDFRTSEGKELLLKTIEKLWVLYFEQNEPNKKAIEIAQRMKADGMDNELIAKYTNLPVDIVEKIEEKEIKEEEGNT